MDASQRIHLMLLKEHSKHWEPIFVLDCGFENCVPGQVLKARTGILKVCGIPPLRQRQKRRKDGGRDLALKMK
jgi:hypothetical protein